MQMKPQPLFSENALGGKKNYNELIKESVSSSLFSFILGRSRCLGDKKLKYRILFVSGQVDEDLNEESDDKPKECVVP